MLFDDYNEYGGCTKAVDEFTAGGADGDSPYHPTERRPGQGVNSSRVYLDRFAATAGAATPAGGRVLDAGAGDGPYRHHFDGAELRGGGLRGSAG